MKLHDYLVLKDQSPTEFSNEIKARFPAVKAGARAVIKWARGERTPRPDAMAAIVAVTNSLVTANDFIVVREAA